MRDNDQDLRSIEKIRSNYRNYVFGGRPRFAKHTPRKSAAFRRMPAVFIASLRSGPRGIPRAFRGPLRLPPPSRVGAARLSLTECYPRLRLSGERLFRPRDTAIVTTACWPVPSCE